MSDGRDAGQEQKPLRRVDVLVVDELGARSNPSAWATEKTELLIAERHKHGLPMIVTSNYPPSELAARFGKDDLVRGQRIVSRLCEGARQVRFSGIDRRIAKAADVVAIERGRRP